MEKAGLLEIIGEVDKLGIDSNTVKVMDAYHRLDALDEPYLSEMIDDYILGKLDDRRKEIFENHLPLCERCRKELAIMRVFIKEVKDLGDEIL